MHLNCKDHIIDLSLISVNIKYFAFIHSTTLLPKKVENHGEWSLNLLNTTSLGSCFKCSTSKIIELEKTNFDILKFILGYKALAGGGGGGGGGQ